MTRPRIEQVPASRNPEPSTCAVELIADELMALVEEFEAAISHGDVPADFAFRLAKIRAAAEALIDK